MEFGILSLLPPIIAIVLALLTKEVISSLLLGTLAGTIIYARGNIITAVETLFDIMAEKLGGNIYIILFLALLGALVVIVTKAGCSRAYGNWAAQKLKSKRASLLATAFLGVLIFIDDYFNCLTVGAVMKPVTDKHRVSRAKLSYIIDATAAPICIIAPISSWAVAVGSTIEESGIANGIGVFTQTIPFNLYAILTIIMVAVVACSKRDFGPMAKFEKNARETGDLHSNTEMKEETNLTTEGTKGRVFDLVIPIVALIIFSVLAMLYVGGFFAGGVSVKDAFGNTDASKSLVLGGFAALVVAFVLYLPRKVLSFKEFMGGITEGVKSMVSAFIILTLAWTISGVCRDFLGTGDYVGHLVEVSNIPLAVLPAIIFIIAGLLAFATGTSWGTFGILLPIVVIIFGGFLDTLLVSSIAATLAGAVFGDHISPISDTTILASTGANCNHIDHVSTQIPYASLVAGVCFVGYLIAGFTQNVYITLVASIVLLAAALFVAYYLAAKKEKKANA
ncbi:MAG: Na+/H+ antiporter NhaC family protein [Oscillospiraceae bacterium]|nr:Na+/H+ antiporter NhaC family protein [Oscillospiraceae bacterium]